MKQRNCEDVAGDADVWRIVPYLTAFGVVLPHVWSFGPMLFFLSSSDCVGGIRLLPVILFGSYGGFGSFPRVYSVLFGGKLLSPASFVVS